MRATLDKVAELLTSTRMFGALALVLPLLVMVFRNGLGTFPRLSIIQHLVIARDFPGPAAIPADATYLYNSMASAITAHYLGVSSVGAWIVMSAVLLAVAIGVVAVMAVHAADRGAMGLVLAVFAAAGVSTVMLGWIGSYDVYTLMALTVLALSRKWWLTLIGAFVAGGNWFEMSLVVVVALVVVGWGDGKARAIRAVVALVGLLAGRLVVMWWQASSGASGSRVDYVSDLDLVEGFKSSLQSMPTLAFTWLAAATVLAGWMFVQGVVPRWRLVLAFVIALAPSFIALDQTRVGALTAWPVIAWLTIESYRQNPAGTKRAVAAMLLIACVYPALVFWEGELFIPMWWLSPVQE